MKVNFKQIGIAIVCVVLLLGLDQYTKSYIVSNFSLYQHLDVIPNLLYITYVQNTGAAFSLFEGFGNVFFGLITIVALIFIAYLYGTTKDWHYRICYVLVFAGAIGNFIDRMTLSYVRDFIGVYIGSYAFPVFNVADICITCGFGLLIILMIYDEVKEKQKWKQEASK